MRWGQIRGTRLAGTCGDWAAAVQAATASLTRPTAERDVHLVAISAWLRVLRAEAVPDAEVDQAVEAARRSGFHRVLRSTLAHAALCPALQGRTREADGLLAELDDDRAGTTMHAFGEWVTGATHASALLGGGTAEQVRAMLDCSPRRTPWVEAGLATVAGALADDDPAAQHLRAAGIYAAIGDGTNRILAVAAAAGALRIGGDPRLADVAAELADFAKRNAAERLLSW